CGPPTRCGTMSTRCTTRSPPPSGTNWRPSASSGRRTESDGGWVGWISAAILRIGTNASRAIGYQSCRMPVLSHIYGASFHRNLCRTAQNRVAGRHIMAEAGLATRSIAELPDLEALFPDSGAEAFSEDYAELFALDAPIVSAGPHRVLVFRNADLRA